MRRFGSNTKGSPKATWNHRDLFGNRLCILVSDTARCPQQCGSDASECKPLLLFWGWMALNQRIIVRRNHCVRNAITTRNIGVAAKASSARSK